MTEKASFNEILFSSLVQRPEYHTAVAPYLKTEYFGEDSKEFIVLDEIQKFALQYGTVPNAPALLHQIQKRTDIKQNMLMEANHFVDKIFDREAKEDLQWLIKETETFCQDRAIYNAVVASIDILDGKHKKLTKHAIPEMLSKALSVSFDSSLGHNFLDDAPSRYDFYHEVLNKIPFDIETLNLITDGGLSKAEMLCLVGGTGTGKTMVMNHMAAFNLLQGRNVLYISMEMADKKIGARIDQNVLDMKKSDIKMLTRDRYMKKIADVKAKTVGKLVIRQYPTSSASAAHFKFLMEELKMKENFRPDIVYIDYINICSSSRIRSSENSYTFIKAIAEELRGLAVEFNVALVTATQTNRNGQNASDFDLKEVAESAGLSHTCDLMLGLIVTDELEEMGRMKIKQLKNRNESKYASRTFDVGIDREKMKLFDLKNSSTPVSTPPPPSKANQTVPKSTKKLGTLTIHTPEENNDRKDPSQWLF